MPALLPGAFTFFAMVWPALPGRGEQTIAAQWDAGTGRGFWLGLTDGGTLTLKQDGERFSVDARMLKRQWYAVGLRIDTASGHISLEQRRLQSYPFIADRGAISASIRPATGASGFMLAGVALAYGGIGQHFDGKIDSPCLLAGAHTLDDYAKLRQDSTAKHGDLIARWDFSRGLGTIRVEDTGPFGLHGTLVNLPTRGMKGWNWTGEAHDWRQQPEHYGAIHFYHDDLYDAGWAPSVTFAIPDDLKSGPCALRIRSGPSDETATREDYI